MVGSQFDPPPPETQGETVPEALPSRPSSAPTIVTVLVIALLTAGFIGVIYKKGAFGNHSTQALDAQSVHARAQASAEDDTLSPETVNDLHNLMTQMSAERKDQKATFDAGMASIDNATRSISDIEAKLRRVEQATGDLQARGGAGGSPAIDPQSLGERPKVLFQAANEFLTKAILDRGWYGWAVLEKPFTAWATSQNPTLTPVEIRALHDAAQIQREALADQHLDMIPDLTRKRAALRIPRDDMGALVQFVWSERASLPPYTSGQLVSMAHLVSRATLSNEGGLTPGGSPLALGNALEPQDLLVPRPMVIGFVPAKTTDLVSVIGMAAPYFTGGTNASDQNQALAAFLTTRSQAIAASFLQRQTGSAGILSVSISDEGSRFTKIPHVVPDINSASGTDQQRSFTAAVLTGMTNARAIREGVFDPNKIVAWEKDLAAVIPSSLIGSLDLEHLQQSYSSLLSRDSFAPILPPLAAEAMDRGFRPAAMAAIAKLPERYRLHFLQRAAIAAATVSVVESRTGETPSVESAITAIQQVVLMEKAAQETQEVLDIQVIPGLVDAYASLFDTNYRDWTQMPAVAQETAARVIDDTLSSVDRRTVKPDSDLLNQMLLSHAKAETEGLLARTAALDVIQAQITRDAATAPIALIKIAREHAVKRAESTIIPPMTHEAVIRQTWAIARECQAIATGKRRLQGRERPSSANIPVGGAAPLPSTTSAPYPKTVPLASTDPISLQTAGDDEPLPAVRKVTIPAGSYARARVFSGVMCELGRTEPEPMLVNLNYAWNGPAGSTLVMRDLRLIVNCTAMDGAKRVRTKLVSISYALPNGTRINSPANGWVVDDVKGIGGVIGTWEFNWDIVIPLSAVDTGLGGLAALLRPQQTITNVNVNTTVQQPEQQPAGEKLGQGMAQGAADSVGKQVTKIIDRIMPALEVPNNQAVTVCLKEDVVLDVPVDQWETVVTTVDQTAAQGYTH